MRRIGWYLVMLVVVGLAASAAECPPGKIPVTFKYIPLPGEEVVSVSLRGTFNDWGQWPMERQPDGTWSITVCLAPGRYEYKYFINGQWPKDMSTARGGGPVDLDADGYVDDGFGGKNAVRVVGSSLGGQWDFKMKLIPSPDVTYNILTLSHTFAGYELKSITKYNPSDPLAAHEQAFELSGLAMGMLDLKAGLYFDYQDVAYKYAFIEGKVNVMGAELTAKAEHWAEPYLPDDRCPVPVTFRYVPAPGETVTWVKVAGDFTDWGANPIPMTYDPSTGEWSVTVYLTPGSYKYKYLLSDLVTASNPEGWVGDMATGHPYAPGQPVDPDAEGYVDDGYGGKNAVRIVRSTCRADLVAVTLTYKPRSWQTTIYEITVPGSWPTSSGYGYWNPSDAPVMTQQPDGTWAVTFYLPPGIYEYKYFIKDNTNPGGYWVLNMADFGGEGPASPEADGYLPGGNAVLFVSDPMPSYMRYTFSAQWQNLEGTLRLEDCCCGIMFKDLTLKANDISLCCGVTYDAELRFAKHGFEYLKLTADNLFELCCGIGFGVDVTFGVDYKRISPRFSWQGISGCLDVYGDVQAGGTLVEGLEVYGFKLRCDLAECNWIEVLTAFDVAKIEEILEADIFQGNEFEYIKIGTCGPACCGGNWNLTVTAFFGGGSLFDITRIWFDLDLPLTEDIKLVVNISPTIPEAYFGWSWKF